MGPGDRLKAERIELGLSIEDVATRMHLSVGILEAIEDNNFDDITAPIFVKGYLRGVDWSEIRDNLTALCRIV